MYKIRTNVDKPSAEYLLSEARKLMERGICVNNAARFQQKLASLRDGIKKQIADRYKIENPNSPKQIGDFLQRISDNYDREALETMNTMFHNDILELCYVPEKDAWTSKKDVLLTLNSLGYDFATDILEYRLVKKYCETVDSLMKFSDSNGRIHPGVRLTISNRLSYYDPALMNIPKKILWAVLSPLREGDYIYSVDIKNQEPSILFGMLGDEGMLEALRSPEGLYEYMFKKAYVPKTRVNLVCDAGLEPHAYEEEDLRAPEYGLISPMLYTPIIPGCRSWLYNGERITQIQQICCGKGTKELPDKVAIATATGRTYVVGVEWEQDVSKLKKDTSVEGRLLGIEVKINKADRMEFKRSWLAFSYGASIKGIEDICSGLNGDYVYKWFSKIDSFKSYKRRIGAHIKAGNDTINTLFGDTIDPGVPIWEEAKLKRSLLNAPIQGTAAGVLSLLMKNFYNEIERLNLYGKIEVYYTRHDEFVLEVNGEWADSIGDEEVKKILNDIFAHQLIINESECEPFRLEIGRIERQDTIDIDIWNDDEESEGV